MFSLKNVFSFIHPEGWKFALISLFISTFFFFIWLPIAILGCLITLFIIWFFRDPERVTPSVSGTVYSPADGVICLIDESLPPLESGLEAIMMKRVCVFMNVFNVHVNRIPFGGKVTKLAYEPGAFFNASLDKASKDNERMTVKIEIEKGIEIVVVQIAGLIARRIKCDLSESQIVKTGEKYGIIRFGSRVDVYLPLSYEVNVLEGQTMIGGETVLADALKKSEKKIIKKNVSPQK